MSSDQSAAEIVPAAEEATQEAEEPETAYPDSLTISPPWQAYGSIPCAGWSMIYSRGPLLSKATGGHFGADKELITALDEAGISTTTASFISMVKEHGGLTGLTFADNKINFTGFPLTEDVDMNTAFQQIACLMHAHALDQKRIQAKVVNDDNEKYAFRIWLLRIGMNGDEFKTSRKILMENLSGHSAFRTKDEEERWKARQKEKREELKAAKAAMKEEEEATKEADTDEE